MANPLDWTLVDSKPFYKDNWFSLRSDTYRLPDGRVISPCFVLEYGDWVNIVAITKYGMLVLERQFRPGLGKTILELPGGAMDSHDGSALEAARRELLEETGYASENFVEIGRVCPNPGNQNNWTHFFLALDCERVAEPQLDETEHLEVALMPFEEAVRLAIDGGFYQSLNVSGLFFALARLGRIG